MALKSGTYRVGSQTFKIDRSKMSSTKLRMTEQAYFRAKRAAQAISGRDISGGAAISVGFGRTAKRTPGLERAITKAAIEGPPPVTEAVTPTQKELITAKYRSTPFEYQGRRYYGEAAATKIEQLGFSEYARSEREASSDVIRAAIERREAEQKAAVSKAFFPEVGLGIKPAALAPTEEQKRQAKLREGIPVVVTGPTMKPREKDFSPLPEFLRPTRYTRAGLEPVFVAPKKDPYDWVPKGMPASIEDVGFRADVPIVGGLVSARYGEVYNIERRYRIKLAEARDPEDVVRAKEWKRRELSRTEKLVGAVKYEKEDLYKGLGFGEEAHLRFKRLDVPFIDVELGHTGRVALTGLGLSAYAIGGAVGAATVTRAALAAGAGVVGYSLFQPVEKAVTGFTGYKPLGLAAGIVVGTGLVKYAQVGKPIQAIKIPGVRFKGDATRYTGLQVRGRPIIGVAGKHVVVGTRGAMLDPKAMLKTITKTKPYGELKPATKLETTFVTAAAKRAAKTGEIFAKEQTRLSAGLGVSRLLKGEPSRFLQKPGLDLSQVKYIKKAANPLEKLIRSEKVTIYGSYAQRVQMAGRGFRLPADIDIKLLTTSAPKAKAFVDKAATIMKRSYGAKNVRVEGNLISVKIEGRWHHALDIKTQTEAGYVGPEIGFGFEAQKAIKIEGQEFMSLGEQVTRKGASAVTLRVTPKSKFFVDPDVWRVKDISDLISGARTLIESGRRGVTAPLKLPRIRAAEVQLEKFIGTRAQPEQLFFGQVKAPPTTFYYKPPSAPGVDVWRLAQPYALASAAAADRYPSPYALPSMPPSYGIPSMPPSMGLPSMAPVSMPPVSMLPSMIPSLKPISYPKPSYRYPPSKPARGVSRPSLSAVPSAVSKAYASVSPKPSVKPKPYKVPYRAPVSKAPAKLPPYKAPSRPPSLISPLYAPGVPKRGVLKPLAPPPKLPEKEKKGFDVYVKRKQTKKGKGSYLSRGFVRVNTKPLTRDSAFVTGAQAVDKYTNRSFTIRPSMKTATGPDPLGSHLQLYKQKFRTQKKNKNIFVEKTKYAIDSLQEKQGIPFESVRQRRAGIIKPRKRRKK